MEINLNYPKLVFGNIVNNLMIGTTSGSYAKPMHAVMPRKLWLLNKGDVLVIPAKINHDFKKYVLDTLNLSENDITILSVEGEDSTILANRIVENEEYTAKIQTIIQNNPDLKLLGFAYDKETIQWAKNFNIGLLEYKDYPSEELQALFYNTNTKSGFREIAHKLGLPTLDGASCWGKDELIEKSLQFLTKYSAIIIKLNRSSNGFGHKVIVRKNYENEEKIVQDIEEYISKYSEQPQAFIIEEFVKFKNLPSVEIVVGENMVSELYTCNQFCVNNSWSGMITPPVSISDKEKDTLKEIGITFGNYVREIGFRGICDVDLGQTENGRFFVSESNFRRTGGTYLDYVVRRLVDEDYYKKGNFFWLADWKLASNTETELSFSEILKILSEENILFDKVTKKGVIISCYTYDIDKKLRYLIVGDSQEYVETIEQIIIQKFNLLN